MASTQQSLQEVLKCEQLTHQEENIAQGEDVQPEHFYEEASVIHFYDDDDYDDDDDDSYYILKFSA